MLSNYKKQVRRAKRSYRKNMFKAAILLNEDALARAERDYGMIKFLENSTKDFDENFKDKDRFDDFYRSRQQGL